jgi:hypothetical protein
MMIDVQHMPQTATDKTTSIAKSNKLLKQPPIPSSQENPAPNQR